MGKFKMHIQNLFERIQSSDHGAILSEDRMHRYVLWRRVGSNSRILAFVGLNPSTADETENDQTIRRCMAFACREGSGIMLMLNLFSFRATNWRVLFSEPVMTDPANDDWLKKSFEIADEVVFCWGNQGGFNRRDEEVGRMVRKPRCFGFNENGAPKHPSRLPRHTELQNYRAEA